MQAESKFTKRSLPILLLLFSAVIPQQSYAEITQPTTVSCVSKSVVYFSPDDKPQKHLISHIKNAKSTIYAAVYMLTDKKIAESLIAAKQRGVDVQIVTDQCSVDSQYGKIFLLKSHGIKIYVFKISTAQYHKFDPLMHNKFAIFDNKDVWTGSFNWTVSANRQNQENVICTCEKKVCERYLTQFEKLKERCMIKPIKSFKSKKLKSKNTRKPRFKHRRQRR